MNALMFQARGFTAVPQVFYSREEYPTYDNCKAIDLERTGTIPGGYDGVMDIPLTFLDKHNPEQ